MTKSQYLSHLHELPCVICEHLGMTQSTGTEVHHVESVRDIYSDFAAVVVCVDHHRGANGIHGLGRRGFAARYQLSDIDLVARTVKAFIKEFA